jgi:hypothetical protein
VLSVDPDGTASVEMRVEEADVTLDGERQAVPATQPVRMRISRDGRLLAGSGNLGSAGAASGLNVPGLDQFTPLLPDHPVQPGDSWSKDFTAPFPIGDGELRYRSRNTFLRYEQLGGTKAAVIRSALTLLLDFQIDIRQLAEISGQGQSGFPAGTNPKISYGGTMSYLATNWFDPKGGQQLKSSIDGTMDIRMRFIDFPPEQSVPAGEVTLSGKVRAALERLT